jgi:hypothetical protein
LTRNSGPPLSPWSALSYIIKPFAMAEFFRAIDRVILLPGAPSPEAQGAVGLAPA